MVWKDELDASRKPRTPPQNEAERVLNFLESMRVPQRESGKGIAEQESSVSMSTVKVPLPSSREEERRTSSRLRAQSPFTRSSRNQQYEANNEGLRSKLKRPPRQEKELGMSIGGAGDRSKGEPATRTRQAASASAVEDDGASGSEDETARRPTTRSKRQERESSFDDEVEEPPRRRNVIRTRAQKQQIAPDAMDEGAESSPRRLRSGRALPASAPAPRATPSPKKPAVELPPSAAASRTGSIGEVSRAHSKDTFKVLVDHPNGSRQKSSLRQRSDKQGPVTREPAARPRGTNRVAFVDSDDEESSAAEEAASQELKKVDLPKIAFPAGFKFTPTTSPSGTPPPASTPLAALPAPGDDANHEAAAASNVSTPSVSASNFEPHRSASVFEAAPPFSAAPGGGVKQPGGSTLGVGEKAGGVFSSAAQPSGDSLLSRIAPPPAQSEDESTTPRKPPPKIGFTLPETNHTASKTEAEVGGPPKPLFPSQPALASTAASPGFFSKPSNATPIEHRQDERNSGPPPNFFGAAGVSAPAKSNPSTNTIQPAGSVVPFSFAKPAPNAQEQPVTPTNTFSFGQLPAPAPKTGSFSFGPAPSLSKLGSEAEHTNSDGGANTAPVASPLTASGKLGESVGLGTPSQPFNGFGGLAKPTSSNKRAAEDENHEAQSSAKKGPSQPDLSGESSKPVSAAPFSSFGSGGAALPFGTAASSKAAASAGPTNLFTGFGQTPGKSGAAAPAGTSASTASSTFSFGAAPSTPAPEAAQPGFSFGAAASAAPSSTPSASTPSAISASNPPGQPAHATGLFGNAAPNPKPSQAPFKFGAPNTAQNGAVASSAAPSQPVAAASSNGGFGAPAINTSAGQSFGSASPASPGGFAFGSTSSNPPMTGLFGSNVNSGGFNAPAASASAGNAPAPFKFGTPANAGTGTGNGAFGGFGAGANAQANPTASSGGFGAFGSGSSNSIGFGANAQPSASDSRQESPFTFGQPSNAPGGGNSRQSSPFTFGVPQQGNAQQPSLGAFGSGASNNAGGGFTFSVPSPAGSRGASPAAAPANPFGQAPRTTHHSLHSRPPHSSSVLHRPAPPATMGASLRLPLLQAEACSTLAQLPPRVRRRQCRRREGDKHEVIVARRSAVHHTTVRSIDLCPSVLPHI
ncbi:hypothetical protein IE81DRAFT_38086 [Ceraceosorus guamensis]|uniref:Uncharacterized protein n=1 Tax=Ceraceosorus guamensis TaxID=1522189 RepID=A0A316W347_9BASI|nr:hypothetical protein IE81DRAFT_38086 [Ceraceosorus guamensis]PWN44210.1 hypothetical protein IE81DRAFT_38086 [Ceraceosorus guamensis]